MSISFPFCLFVFWTIVHVSFGFPQENDILQQIYYGTKSLYNSTSKNDPPQFLLQAIEFIKNLKDPNDSNDAICKSCQQVIDNIIALRKSGTNKADMMDYFNKLCKVYTDWGVVACKGYTQIEIDTILYIIDNKKDLKPARFCAIQFQLEKCVDPDAVPWSIPLPPRQLINIKGNTTIDSSTLNVLQLTDIHYDPLYTPGSNAKCDQPLCCQTGVPTKPENAAGYWGDYNVCDMPWHSVENLMDRVKEKHKNVDIVYFTGDIISHKSWATDIKSNSESIISVLQLFGKTFPNKKVFPILGNHEPHPSDFYSPDNLTIPFNVSTRWIFNLAAEEWSRWLPNDTQTTIKKGGFYTVLVQPGFRIIALNSNVCFTHNLWLLYDDTDPYNQLQWLVNTLLEAEKNREKVHLLSHIPPGEVFCHKQWSYEFKKIILRFSDTISAQFNGHTHFDEWRLFFDSSNLDQPKSVAYNGGSFTTFVGYNPNYRIYQIKGNDLTVSNYDQYTYNLTKANQNPETPPEWFKLYSFKEAYGLPDLQLKSLGKLYWKMAASNSDNNLVDQYYKFMVRESDDHMKEGCDSKCKKSLVCAIAAVETNESINC